MCDVLSKCMTVKHLYSFPLKLDEKVEEVFVDRLQVAHEAPHGARSSLYRAEDYLLAIVNGCQSFPNHS